MITRNATGEVRALARQFTSVAIVGSRQSGKTITSDYFKNFPFWNKITGFTERTVIYAGNELQKRNNTINVIPWDNFQELPE